jgi:hypothetical protein
MMKYLKYTPCILCFIIAFEFLAGGLGLVEYLAVGNERSFFSCFLAGNIGIALMCIILGAAAGFVQLGIRCLEAKSQ